MAALFDQRFVERYLTAWHCAGAGWLMWLLADSARYYLPRLLGLVYVALMVAFLFRALFKGGEWVAAAQKALKQQHEIELVGPTEWALLKAAQEATTASDENTAARPHAAVASTEPQRRTIRLR